MFPVLIVLGLVVSSGIFIITIVKDKEDKMRYILHFTGMRPFAYYGGMIIADITLFSIPIFALILMSYILSISAFYNNGVLIFFIFIAFGFPFICLIYMTGFLFSKSEKAFKYGFLVLLGI